MQLNHSIYYARATIRFYLIVGYHNELSMWIDDIVDIKPMQDGEVIDNDNYINECVYINNPYKQYDVRGLDFEELDESDGEIFEGIFEVRDEVWLNSGMGGDEWDGETTLKCLKYKCIK